MGRGRKRGNQSANNSPNGSLTDFDVNDDMKKNFAVLFKMMKEESAKAEQRHNEVKSEILKLKGKYVLLKKSHVDLQKKFNLLADEMLKVKYSVNTTQQHNLRNNVVIRGLPEIENEDLHYYVTNCFSKMNFNLDNNLVTHCARFGKSVSQDKPRPILLVLQNNETKIKLMEARKNRINCSQIYHNDEPVGAQDQKIYVDDHLTPMTAAIFNEARKLQREKLVQFVWTKNGIVFARINVNSKARRLSSPQDSFALYQEATGTKLKDTSNLMNLDILEDSESDQTDDEDNPQKKTRIS